MNNPVTVNDIMQQAARTPSSQAAGVEHSRAVAEVQAALVVAKQRPRDKVAALKDALESCAIKEVAETAFFKIPRGNQTVVGESIQLAIELARCWGNIIYGINELERDDGGAKSEMLAFAWDLETNTQSRMTFIVPHVRDTKQGPKRLADMRDIYENNANMGARRLRECIFRVLPSYLKEQAKAACYRTIENGGGDTPLPVRIQQAISGFEKLGIGRDRIEAKLGPVDRMTVADVAQLSVSYRSVKRGEVSADEEFPRVATTEVAEQARKIAGKTATDGAISESDGGAAVDADHPAMRIVEIIELASQAAKTPMDIANLHAARADDIDAMPERLADQCKAAMQRALDRFATADEEK